MKPEISVHLSRSIERSLGMPTSRIAAFDTFLSLSLGVGSVPGSVSFLVDDDLSPQGAQSLISGFRAFADALEQRRWELGE